MASACSQTKAEGHLPGTNTSPDIRTTPLTPTLIRDSHNVCPVTDPWQSKTALWSVWTGANSVHKRRHGAC